jgi:putative endonuclease
MRRRIETEESRLTRLPRPERQLAFRLGVSAETRAAVWLMAKGYRVVGRRWKSPVGEIDLVVRRGRLLVFVEVKARPSVDDAAEAVTARQQRRIIAAAKAWLARHPGDLDRDIRFDAVLVVPWRLPRHLQAAFDATEFS